ncbi:hypothetical protein [Amycolatopsis lexingtonensis]|uniref:hypothetical protein n=1 Tax=Amycolatopsis lexingtonensis TaxID=218822 RepID=UPI003F708694
MIGYPWHVVAASLTIDWSAQGDEWLYRFSRALAETSVSVTGHLYDATTEPFLRINLQGGNNAGTVVLLAFTTDSVFVMLAGESETDENFVGVVTKAAEHAAATLGDEGEEIPWTAIIGPGPERISGGTSRLTAEVSIGSMKLASTDQVLIEPDLTQQRSLTSWGIQRSIPIRVSGSSRGYNWTAASVRATRDLHTLCGLLSVVTDETVVVREAPASTAWGERPVPESLPWYQPSSVDTDTLDLSTATALALPEKLDSAWSRVRQEPVLLAALDTYLEGIQAAPRHPSLAVVSFVASVETVASKLFKFERCKGCKNRLGLGAAFKASLRKVVSEEEAAALDSVYSARSKTVHAGRLHGGETTPGLLFRGPWSKDTASDFRWQTLWRLRNATRLLLAWSIANPWPARTPITPG